MKGRLPFTIHLTWSPPIADHSTPGNYPKANGQIRATTVRVVDEHGEMLGVFALQDAIKMAEKLGLDLVEISPGAQPPVCKIIDFGKYKYQLQKKEHEKRKHQKIVQLKEIKLRPTIGEHDYQVKLRSIHEFIQEGDKVKITLRFRGREFSHQDIGREVLQRVKRDTEEYAKVELEPRLEGKQLMMQLGPK